MTDTVYLQQHNSAIVKLDDLIYRMCTVPFDFVHLHDYNSFIISMNISKTTNIRGDVYVFVEWPASRKFYYNISFPTNSFLDDWGRVIIKTNETSVFRYYMKYLCQQNV